MTLGLGIAVSVVVVASANVNRSDEGNLSSRELLVQVGDPFTAPSANLTADEVAQLDARAAAVVAALGTGDTAVALDVALRGDTGQLGNAGGPVTVGRRESEHQIRFLAFAYLATPEVLAR